MRTARYQAVPPKIDRRLSIEGEKGKKKKRKRKKRREENLAPILARAPSSPSPALRRRTIACARRRPHPREETERLPRRGERSRRQGVQMTVCFHMASQEAAATGLIANVTYGYTAAGFSGRMPCAELADSIVQCGRRTLEAAISFVNEHPKWKARVEVHLGSYSTRMSSLPPAAIVAIKAMNADPRAEPHYGERVPYVVVYGEPGARLADMVVDPHDLLEVNSPYRLNDHYYIKKQIIPALQRVLGLLRADLNQWFLEVPRPVRPISARFYASHFGSSHDFDYNGPGTSRKAQVKRSRIDTYYSSKHCILCGDLVQRSKYLCDVCFEKKPLTATALVSKTSTLERDIQHLVAVSFL
ncbi:hypothetical protein BHE74_00003103 [Ensete ventricosum]|nr:hypothetical protein BHE74_00003103 [Ensete ventricosum]